MTYEKNIRVYGTICDGAIDYNRLIDVDDVGYVLENDDIVVVKNGVVYSLFYENDYSSCVPNLIDDTDLNGIIFVD